MDVNTIANDIWMRLSLVALRDLTEFRRRWTAAHKGHPVPRAALNLDRPAESGKADLSRYLTSLVFGPVSYEFYHNIYSKTTSEMPYTASLGPEHVDAGWQDLVNLWWQTEQAQQQKADVPEPLKKVKWVADEDRKQCATRTCGARFGVFGRRRHHCRLCGEVFCDNCTRKRLDIRNPLKKDGRVQGVQQQQRVCDGCHDSWTRFLKTGAVAEGNTTNVEVQISPQTGVPGARLWEKFTQGKLQGRLQFVVTEGGVSCCCPGWIELFSPIFMPCPMQKSLQRLQNLW